MSAGSVNAGSSADADGWGLTLAAALIGADRAPARQAIGPLADIPASGDAGGDLLAQIGALGAYHLAGAGLGPDVFVPLEPFAQVGPECPPAAAARFVTLIGSCGAIAGIIAEWCEVAAERGLRLPPELVPLLEDFRGTADQPRVTQAIAGPELAWLRQIYGDAPAEDEVGDPDDEDDTESTDGDETAATQRDVSAKASSVEDWLEGSPQQRRAAFYGFRRRDPDGARTALEAVFKSEKADAREQFLNAFEVGLAPADEPFLETCLDDRAGGVRRVAQRLLPQLQTSRFMERMAARVAAALHIDESKKLLVGKKHQLVVTLPEEAPDLVRDGIEPSQYAWKKRGAKAQLLEQILRNAPLKAFAAHPPRVWVEQALQGEWSEPILVGLVAALWRERDPAWRSALIETLSEAHAGKISGIKSNAEIRDALAKSIATLPQPEWEETVAKMLKSAGIEQVIDTTAYGPETYSSSFTEALFDWIAFRLRGGPESIVPLRKGSLISRLGQRADPSDDSEAAAAAIVSRLPEDFDTYLRHQLNNMSETLSLRVTIRREFATR